MSDTLTELRAALAGVIEPNRPVLTYRCRFCKEVVILRGRDLFLSAGTAAVEPSGRRP